MFVYSRKQYAVAQFTLDLLSLVPIWRLGTYFRVHLNPLMSNQLTPIGSELWTPYISVVALLWAAASLRLHLYSIPVEIRARTVLRWAGENTVAVCILTILTTYFSRQVGVAASRSFVLCILPIAFLILVATRTFALLLINGMQRRQQAPRVALVGDRDEAASLMDSLQPNVASSIQGVIVPATSSVEETHSIAVLGTIEQLGELINRERIDRAIIINQSLPDCEIERCKKIFWRMGLPVSYAVDIPREMRKSGENARASHRLELSRLYGLPTVEVRPVVLSRNLNIGKRLFDLALASALLVILSPVMLLATLILRLKTGGPVLERTLHVGLGGRHFHCLKFRPLDEEDESRSAKFVRLLLRRRGDELPQLMNILRGRMSFVGPAPLPVRTFETTPSTKKTAGWRQTRFLVQPGLTGLWQVGHRTFSFSEMIQLDLEYIQSRSFLIDLRILLRTPIGVLKGIRVAEAPQPAAYLVADAS